VGGRDAWSTAAKRLLGYCPDVNTFYEEMTGREFVWAMASLYGYPWRELTGRTNRALEEVGMADLADKRLAGCSHGMRQRIKVAQALVHDPPILLLDEPLSGIDPGGRRSVNDLLFHLAERGKAILVSSHILVEIEHLADTVLMISRGRLIASGTLAEVRAKLEDHPLLVEIACRNPRRLAALLFEASAVLSAQLHEGRVQVRTAHAGRFFAALNALVLEHGIEVERLETLDAGADAIFSYLLQQDAK
jgi:ABC-2 type transport system ATP-binding protein